jgi:hypothetical protein
MGRVEFYQTDTYWQKGFGLYEYKSLNTNQGLTLEKKHMMWK